MNPETEPHQARDPARKSAARMPADSLFYTRVVPLLLAGMGVLMLVLILFAAGIALGWIQF